MADENIEDIGSFLKLWRAELDLKPGSAWFRGQADANWKLLPGFFRKDQISSETTLMNRFRQSAAMLTESLPRNSFDWMFLMQHYGIQTRLLDWSENPLVALYFAVSDHDAHPGADAALWCMWPTALNLNANIVDKIEGDYIPSFEDEELSNYSTESVRSNSRIELYPVATIATRNNPRIQAQMGTFTIHHNKKIAIEDVGDRSHVKKFIIPSAARDDFLKDLRLLGLNKFSLFPELASVGDALKELMK